MLWTAASVLLLEIAVVWSVRAELRISDILSAELLPSTLLLEGNMTRRSIPDQPPVAFKIMEALKRRSGNWSLALSTMDFHRKMMNEYLCRNYVAEQILEDMALPLPADTASPPKKGGPVKKEIASTPQPSPFVLRDVGEPQDVAEDRMDRNVSPSGKADVDAAPENDPENAPGVSEARSAAPMFRKKSSASLKKTRRKKKKNNERNSSSGRRRTDHAKSNSLLSDTGSADYKDWLTRTALLEDIYRHYDHLAIPSEDSAGPSPAPVVEVSDEDTPNTGLATANTAASASDGSGGVVLPNLGAFEGGEVTGYAVTHGASLPPAVAAAAAGAAAAAAAASHGGANMNVRPVQFSPSAATIKHHQRQQSMAGSGPIPVATSINSVASAPIPQFPQIPQIPQYPSIPQMPIPPSPHFAGHPAVAFPGTARFPSYGSLPASVGLTSLPGFTSIQGSPAVHTSVPEAVPAAAYGERGGAFSHGDIHTEYEIPTVTSEAEEHHHHHHMEHEHKSGKLLSLEDLFDLVLTAIAFLAFGAFVVHIIMCLLNTGQQPYYSTMDFPVTAPGPALVTPTTGAATGAQSGAQRQRRKRRKRDAVSGAAGVLLDGVAPAALDRAAASVLTSIDAALSQIRAQEKQEEDQAECLLRAICAHNRRSRSAPGMLRVWMPVWSLGLSWVVGRNTSRPAGNTLANLRAALLGLSGTRCRTAFPRCRPRPTTGPSDAPAAQSPKSPRPAPPPDADDQFAGPPVMGGFLRQRPSPAQDGLYEQLIGSSVIGGSIRHGATPAPDTYKEPIGPPGVGGFTRFTPVAIKTHRKGGAERRKKKP